MVRTEKVRMEDALFPADRRSLNEPLSGPAPVLEKRRLLRIVVVLTLVGISLAVAVLWQRDSTYIQKSLQRMERYRRAVQAALDSSHQLPLVLPKVDPDGRPLAGKWFVYLPVDDVQDLRDYPGSVVVGYSLPISAAIKADGRAVLLCERGKCEVRWMTHGQFSERRKAQDAWIAHRREQLLKAPPKRP